MNFYEIKIEDIPKVEFVCLVEKNNYCNRFPYWPNLLEISLCLSGNIVFSYHDGTERLVEPNMTAIVTKNTVCKTFAEKPGIQRHITFGVTVPHRERLFSAKGLRFSDFSDIEKRVSQNESILLPHSVPLGGDARIVEDIISRGLTNFYSPCPENKLNCLSVWFELCAFLTQVSLKKLRQLFSENLPSDERYIEYAVRYISEHISENIRIEQLANQVGISQGYLQNIFKKVTGLTIIEYINRERVELVKSYTAGGRISLAAAAELVGIEDCSYMSRLFKKVTGMSFMQYQAVSDRKVKQ